MCGLNEGPGCAPSQGQQKKRTSWKSWWLHLALQHLWMRSQGHHLQQSARRSGFVYHRRPPLRGQGEGGLLWVQRCAWSRWGGAEKEQLSETSYQHGWWPCTTAAIPNGNPYMLEEFVQHLRQLLAKKITRKSSSQYASPVVLVRKKSGGLRMCVDFRLPNWHVIRDAYPLPRIEESMDALKGARVFSTMDLQSAYHQVEVAEEDKEKTAFSTPVLVFSSSTGCPLGCQLLLPCTRGSCSRCSRKSCSVKSWSIWTTYFFTPGRWRNTSTSWRKSSVNCIPRASDWSCPRASSFKNVSITLATRSFKDGIATEEDKLWAVCDWPVPMTSRDVRSFLGFCSNYRRYVKGFAQIAKPLHDLVALCESGGPI